MALPSCNHEPMNWIVFSSKFWGSHWARVVLVRKLMAWCFFQFWYQPREALNSGSLHNSLAFHRRINPLTAIPVEDKTSSNIFRSLFWLVLTCFDYIGNWLITSGHSHGFSKHYNSINMTGISLFWFQTKNLRDFFALKTTPEVFDPIQDTSAYNRPLSFDLLTFSARHLRGLLDLFTSDESWTHWCRIFWQSRSCSQ